MTPKMSQGGEPVETCPICSQLKNVETSFYKYAAPEYDTPLPEAASQLIILQTPDIQDVDKYHVRCCPQCGVLYTYRTSYEYYVNGSEDEEELTRMKPAEASAYCLAQARRLETLRQEIESLEYSAGSLGDYIDLSKPSPKDHAAAYANMVDNRQRASKLRQELDEQVTYLRNTCPRILLTWSNAHIRTCNYFLTTLPTHGDDAETARHVAHELIDAWNQLPNTGETFILISFNWLDGYFEHLKGELEAPEVIS